MFATDDPLSLAVERVYRAFPHEGPISELETCFCCMSETEAAALRATPVRSLSNGLLMSYTGSAHGVPREVEHLKALLPRYLELLAEGEEPCPYGLGCVLKRFGDALRENPAFYSDVQWSACMAWMEAFIRAVVANDAAAAPADSELQSSHLVPALVCGGFPAREVTRILGDALLALPASTKALARFGTDVGDALVGVGESHGVDWFSLQYVPRSEVDIVVDWLNRDDWIAPLARTAETPMPWDDDTEFARFGGAVGTFKTLYFPQESWFGVASFDSRFTVYFPAGWETNFESTCYRAQAPGRAGHVQIHFIAACPGDPAGREELLRDLVGAPMGPESERIPRSLFGEGGFVSETSHGNSWRLVHFAPVSGGALVAIAEHHGESPGALRAAYVGSVNLMRSGKPRKWPQWRDHEGGIDYPLTAIAAVGGETTCDTKAALGDWLSFREIHTEMSNQNEAVIYDSSGRRLRMELTGVVLQAWVLEWIQWPGADGPHGAGK